MAPKSNNTVTATTTAASTTSHYHHHQTEPETQCQQRHFDSNSSPSHYHHNPQWINRLSLATTCKLLIVFYVELAIVGTLCSNLKTTSAFYIKDDQNANQLPQVCHGAMPCGWEVYSQNSNTRVSNYFVYSPCKCPEQWRCVRDQEDVRINSYIHRCKFGTTEGNEIEMVKRTLMKPFNNNQL